MSTQATNPCEEVVEVDPGKWVWVTGTSLADLDRQVADLLSEEPLAPSEASRG